MIVVNVEPQEALMEETSTLPVPAVSPGVAMITDFLPALSGLAVAATGSYDAGVGRVDFVLLDLNGDPPANVVVREAGRYGASPQEGEP
jgi:hypothetical protein